MPTVVFDPEQTRLEKRFYEKLFSGCKWPDAVLVEILQNASNLTLLDARHVDALTDGIHGVLAKFLYSEIVFSPITHSLDGRPTGPLAALWVSSRPGNLGGFPDRVRIHSPVSCIVESKLSAWCAWFLDKPLSLFDAKGPSEAVCVVEHVLQRIANVFDGDRWNLRVDQARLHTPGSYLGPQETLRKAHQLRITHLDEQTFTLDELAERFGLTEKPTKRPSEEAEDRLHAQLRASRPY